MADTSTLQHSIRTKTRASFTASLSEAKNARFLAINHTEVTTPRFNIYTGVDTL